MSMSSGLSSMASAIGEFFAKDGIAERWQTFAAGLLAIGAALIGGGYINKQIRSADKQEKVRRQAKFAAARAVLPLTLSYLSAYARASAQALRQIYL